PAPVQHQPVGGDDRPPRRGRDRGVAARGQGRPGAQGRRRRPRRGARHPGRHLRHRRRQRVLRRPHEERRARLRAAPVGRGDQGDPPDLQRRWRRHPREHQRRGAGPARAQPRQRGEADGIPGVGRGPEPVRARQLRVPGQGRRRARPGGGELRRADRRPAPADRGGGQPPRGQRAGRQGRLRQLKPGLRRADMVATGLPAGALRPAAAPAPGLRLRRLLPEGPWQWAAVAIAALVLLPLASLAWTALQGGQAGRWTHVARYVLPGAAWNTLALLAGVGALVVAIGTGAAWLVTAFDFPGRRTVSWALLLPLAVPTYIVAF